jgi:hypothetical protein
MKQSFLLLLCIATLGLASCKKEYITPNARTFVYTIQENEWVLDETGFNYTVLLDIPEIDQITVDHEGVLVSVSHPIRPDNYLPVPATFDTDVYIAEVYNGGIAIDVQSSDRQNTTPFRPTGTIKVKVVVIPSTYVP